MISSSAPASAGQPKKCGHQLLPVGFTAGLIARYPDELVQTGVDGDGQDIPACRSGHARRRWFGGMVGRASSI